MNILLFVIILGALIFVHELGHFLFAKLFKIRVDEFGFGYPPRMFTFGFFKGTRISMNWIPFGGFVKIFGEADEGETLSDSEKKVSLVHKPRWQQALVMFGGILFNVLFAWMLFTGIYLSGVTASVENAPAGYQFKETELMVTGVMQGSPAEEAGLNAGDKIKEYYNNDRVVTVSDETIDDLALFVNESGNKQEDVGIVVLRNEKLEVLTVSPQKDIIPEKYAIGVNIDRVGEMRLPLHQALWYGAKNTGLFLLAITDGFWQLISGKISADNVSGPVGIVNQIGEASSIGMSYLVSFTALLSLNLAVLNLIPFPALDGGRLLIIAIEAAIGKRLRPLVVNWINTVGFFALILLMIVVTIHDITKLF